MTWRPRRDFLATMASLVLVPEAALGQAITAIRRIGFLSPGSSEQRRAERDAFLQEMRQLGYVDGVNLRIEYRWADGKLERLPDLARELARLGVEVILAHTTPGALAAKRATSVIPIVMTNAGDPVGSGLVSSLARPDGNVTGLSMLNVELGGKRLALLKEIVPALSQVFLIWNPGNQGNLFIKQNTESSARILKIPLQAIPVRKAEELLPAFRGIPIVGAAGLIVVEDVITTDGRFAIAEYAARARIPAVYGLSQNVDAGGAAFLRNPADGFLPAVRALRR